MKNTKKSFRFFIHMAVLTPLVLAVSLIAHDFRFGDHFGFRANAAQKLHPNEDRMYFPDVTLPQQVNKENAIRGLGDKLPEVAAWYGYSPQELRELMRKDGDLWLDKKGRLLYKDAGLVVDHSDVGVIEAADHVAGATYSLENTFKLHSNADAKRVIYLDFDGALLSGTAWNNNYNSGGDITAPAWSLDGSSSFSDVEKQRIQNIWQRVAEDYAPFDVDVTTEAPTQARLIRSSLSDEHYGATVLISPISQYIGSYGGIAYVGVFDAVNNGYYQPALVFPEKLSNGEKYISEAISHELGHNLGLSHDGTTGGTTYYAGHGNWAPIMGNSYYKAITQWSKGEYAGANNMQDDLSIIETNGLPRKIDDCNDSVSSSCSVSYGNNIISAWGAIEYSGDTDMFEILADTGSVSIVVATSPLETNLNMQVMLLDQEGGILDSVSSTTSSVTLDASVISGTYYVSVRGMGAGDLVTGYSDYGSLGQYSISGTVSYSGQLPPSAAASANILSGDAPLEVQFSSEGSTDPDGNIASYHWDFGDGTQSDESSPFKTYSQTGAYMAVLTVVDNDGFSDSENLEIQVNNVPPVAMLQTSSVSGNIPLLIHFSGSDSYDVGGSIVSYDWDFGDGAVLSGENVDHTYVQAGSYMCSLTVRDNDGALDVVTVRIDVVDPNVVDAPSDLIASANGALVVLSWQDNSQNETDFYVYRAINKKRTAPVYERVGIVGANVETFTQTVESGSYYYRIAAYNELSSVLSQDSNTISVKVRGDQIKTPPGKGKKK